MKIMGIKLGKRAVIECAASLDGPTPEMGSWAYVTQNTKGEVVETFKGHIEKRESATLDEVQLEVVKSCILWGAMEYPKFEIRTPSESVVNALFDRESKVRGDIYRTLYEYKALTDDYVVRLSKDGSNRAVELLNNREGK